MVYMEPYTVDWFIDSVRLYNDADPYVRGYLDHTRPWTPLDTSWALKWIN